VEDAPVAYAETDLVCYRAGAAEADLAGRQERAWGPLLEWAADRFGARLEATRGIVPHPQAGEALEALARAVAAYADAELAALRAAAATCGSLVIALALLEGEIAPDAAWQAAHLDERAQAERWGVDAEAKAAMAARRGDLEAVAEFVRLWRQE
jgi:chaperone required for assembly of F1-ATPase